MGISNKTQRTEDPQGSGRQEGAQTIQSTAMLAFVVRPAARKWEGRKRPQCFAKTLPRVLNLGFEVKQSLLKKIIAPMAVGKKSRSEPVWLKPRSGVE